MNLATFQSNYKHKQDWIWSVSQFANDGCRQSRLNEETLTLVYSVIASINAYVVWERKVEVLSVTKDTALLINVSLLREWGSGFWKTQTFLFNF